MKRLALAVTAAAIVLTSAGCANNGPTPVSVKAAKALAPFVTALREAASHDSIDEVDARVSDLDSEVTTLVGSNDITQKRGRSIQDAASALESDFKRKNAPTPSPSTSATESTTPTETPHSPRPGPTVTITAPPTDSGSPSPTDSETKGGDGGDNGDGNGLGGGGFPPGHNK